MLWIVDGGMLNLPVVARVEDFKEDSYIEITGATENHEWKSEPTRYEKVVRCKDCEYWDRETVRQNSNDFKWWNEAICKEHSLIGVNEPHEMWVDADWFCADGERR